MSYVLGLSYNYHDAAAALLKDGAIVAASTEERHTRRKHDPNFPARAIAFCLDRAGIEARELDAIAYHEQPLLKFDRILKCCVRRWWNGGHRALREAVEGWADRGKFDVAEQIAFALEVPPERIHFCEHHLSHAASAYFCSPFERATIVTLNGVGEWETCTVSRAEGNAITKIGAISLPHSLGLFYSALTAFLGFEVNEGEYKVMGMAGFGQPLYADQMREWFDLKGDGTFTLRRDLFNFEGDAKVPYLPALLDLLGPARDPESEFDPRQDQPGEFGSARHYANVAASVQSATEHVVEHVVRHAIEKTGIAALCLAGGVALNSAANERLRRVVGAPMFVQPAAGDAGCALGAAKWFHHCVTGGGKREVMTSAALGPDYSDDAIREILTKLYPASRWVEYANDELLSEAASNLLVAGKVIGWFQGRSEWGPRALGQRSILANPCLPDMQARVNEKIKFREPFRPFAPAVLSERAHDFFELTDIAGEDPASNPYNYMLAISRVHEGKRKLLPAITHVDGTARVQSVRAQISPLFYRLIERFGARTNVPVLLNTSFNLRGEPIVDSPTDAINTFEWSGLDALVLGHAVVMKEVS